MSDLADALGASNVYGIGDSVLIRRGMWAGHVVTVDAFGSRGVRVRLPEELWSPGAN